MKNYQILLELYNDLDDLLRERFHEKDRTKSVIIRFINEMNRSGNKEYIKVAKKMNMIRVLRNNLIHELDMNSDNLIEVTDETIKFLNWVINQIKNPRTAKDIATSLDKIDCVKEGDNIKVKSIVDLMVKNGHSQVPVLNSFNIVKGVFSPNVLFSYLAKFPNENIDSISFEDIKDFLPVSKHFSESYLFLPKYLTEEEIIDIFLDSYNDNKKISMAFVTETGKENEPLIGIIVLKDLISKNKN